MADEKDDGKILCTLCPRFCRLGDGQAGFCYIRKNVGGKLYSLGYGTSTGFAVDPIEKKPLNHFLPGTGVLSFGARRIAILAVVFVRTGASAKRSLMKPIA